MPVLQLNWQKTVMSAEPAQKAEGGLHVEQAGWTWPEICTSVRDLCNAS